MSDTYKGACFCGEVAFEVTGTPVVVGYCHCDDCRAWSAAPVNGLSLWSPDTVRTTRGEAHIGSFNKTEDAYRKFCTSCGGHLMTDHPGMNLVDVPTSLLQGFSQAPTLHVNYGKKTVSIKDGLPKFKDLPADFGGSGDTLPD